jgi:tetratricopeptide (TPR) repeat protein
MRKPAVTSELLPILGPVTSKTLLSKGNLLLELESNWDAAQIFEKAIGLNPHSIDAWKGKGIALDNIGLHSEAVECFNIALCIDPLSADIWNYRGIALYNMGMYQEFVDSCRKSLEIKMLNIRAQDDMSKYKYAFDAYNAAIRADSSNPKIWHEKRIAINYATTRFENVTTRKPMENAVIFRAFIPGKN